MRNSCAKWLKRLARRARGRSAGRKGTSSETTSPGTPPVTTRSRQDGTAYCGNCGKPAYLARKDMGEIFAFCSMCCQARLYVDARLTELYYVGSRAPAHIGAFEAAAADPDIAGFGASAAQGDATPPVSIMAGPTDWPSTASGTVNKGAGGGVRTSPQPPSTAPRMPATATTCGRIMFRTPRQRKLSHSPRKAYGLVSVLASRCLAHMTGSGGHAAPHRASALSGALCGAEQQPSRRIR